MSSEFTFFGIISMKSVVYFLAAALLLSATFAQPAITLAGCDSEALALGCNLCVGNGEIESQDCRGCKAGYALTIAESGSGSCALCSPNSGRDADTTPQTSSKTCTATPATPFTTCRVHSSDPTFCITYKGGYHLSPPTPALFALLAEERQ